MVFFDAFRRIRRPVAPTATAGHSGTRIFGGFVENRESKTDLVGIKRYETFSEMLANVSIVSASVRWFLNLVSKAEWVVEPAQVEGRDDEAKRVAERVERAVFNSRTPFHRVVRRSALFKFYGFSLQEWTAVLMDDGLIGFVDIAPRAQKTIERWDSDEHGLVRGVVQRSPHDNREIYLPRTKLVYLVDDSINDSPEGLGLFRHVVEASRRLQRYEQLEGFGFETDLRGMPVGRAPFSELQKLVKTNELSPADKTAMELPLTDFVTKHIKSPQLGLLLDSMVYETSDDAARPSSTRKWDMELLKAGATSQPEVAKAIERMNKEIARTFGTESLLIGGDGVGSLALARDKSENFALIVDSALRELMEAYEDDLVQPIMDLNGFDPALKPKLRTSKVQLRDVKEITGALEQMARSGAILAPDDPVIDVVRGILGLPPQTTEILDRELDLRDRGTGGELGNQE